MFFARVDAIDMSLRGVDILLLNRHIEVAQAGCLAAPSPTITRLLGAFRREMAAGDWADDGLLNVSIESTCLRDMSKVEVRIDMEMRRLVGVPQQM